MEPQKPMRVFLAHSSGDKTYARDVCRVLELDGFAPWLDVEKLIGGQDWQLEIEESIRKADAIVVFLSARAVDSAGYLHKEIGLALDVAQRQPEGSIVLIPVLLDNHDVPRTLRHLHWIDFADFKWEPTLDKDITLFRWLDRMGKSIQEFSIGESYLQLQRALLTRTHQLYREEPSFYWGSHPIAKISNARTLNYIVRGKHADGQRYYGTATMQFHDRDVYLKTTIELKTYEYEGLLESPLIRFTGAHEVTYCISNRSCLLAGSWNQGGIEELIPMAKDVEKLHKQR